MISGGSWPLCGGADKSGMSRGFGATERAILRLLHPPHLDGEFVSLATITHRVYGHAEPNAVESVRRSLHRLARLDRVELARGTVEAEGWQRRLVARLVPWTLFTRRPDFPAAPPFDGAPDALVQSVSRFADRFAAELPWASTPGAVTPAVVDRLLADWDR